MSGDAKPHPNGTMADGLVEELFASIQDGISILGKDMTILRVNPTMERWYAHAMPLVGKKCYEAYHGRREPCQICPTRRTLLTGEPAHEEVPLTGAGGRVLGWLDLYSHALISSATGERLGVIEHVRDITDRVKAREALRESESRFRQLYDEAPVGYHELDTEGRIVSVNQTELRMLGYTEEEMLGRPVWDFVVEKEASQEASRAKLAGVSPPGHGFERTYRRKDGTSLPVVIEDHVIRHSMGHIVGMRSTLQDITARKRMEAVLRAMAIEDELTGLYNRRGFWTLAEQQLKVAARAHESLGLLYVDVDGLKAINDRFGHSEGDRALIEVARLLRVTFRNCDIAARIGGDEFVVLLVQADGVTVEELTRRMETNLEASNAARKEPVLSLSAGAAYYDWQHPCILDELIHRADEVMYRHKRGKRGRQT